MKKILLITAMALALSSNAFATGNHNPPPPPPKPSTPSSSSNASANAAAVAAAAASSKSSSSATGGNASATGGNASIAKGAVENHNSQGQQQAQNNAQSQNNSGNSSSSSSAAGAGAGAGANSGQNNGNGSNNTEVNINNEARRIPVATAYSAGLTSGIDTCLGSASGGVQTGILGVTFGSTKVDKNCVNIKNTHLIAEFSPPAGCAYMLKNIKGASEAFKEVGAVCVPPAVEVVVAGPAPEFVTREELTEHEKRIVQKTLAK